MCAKRGQAILILFTEQWTHKNKKFMIKIQAFKWPPITNTMFNSHETSIKIKPTYVMLLEYEYKALLCICIHSAYLLQLTFESIKSKKANFEKKKSLIIPLKKKKTIIVHCTVYMLECRFLNSILSPVKSITIHNQWNIWRLPIFNGRPKNPQKQVGLPVGVSSKYNRHAILGNGIRWMPFYIKNAFFFFL